MISKSESRSDVLACDGVQLKLTHEAIEGQRQQHCISLAPARLDRFPRGLPAMSLIPFAPLKLARRPRSLAASRAALPSISLIPCARFSLGCSTNDVPAMSRMCRECRMSNDEGSGEDSRQGDAQLKFAPCPRSLTASLAALPSMSLLTFAPLAWHLNEQRRSTTYYAPSIGEKNFKFSKMSIFERLRKE
jgi:hypothetical protein